MASPADVVRHLGAVQSQDLGMSLWSVGRRCGASLPAVERAFATGDFVRTHVLRTTWHHVLSTDLTDLLEVTGPRIDRLLSTGNRAIGLTDDRMRAGADVVAAAVASDGPLTRSEVAQRLESAGFEHTGSALGHIVMSAEISGRTVSGPMRGKQHTYIAADLPPSRRTPDERLAWIAQTYARGHGPFQARDLAWWTSLTLTDARRAIDLADLRPVDIDGAVHVADHDPEPVDVPPALLLSNYDELISYVRDPSDHSHLEDKYGTIMRAGGLLFVRGRLAGSWTRAMRSSSVTVTVRPGVPLDSLVHRAIEQEAAAFGLFCAREPALEIVT
ncbi:MAG: winged helix DNA-binding domain-containing protein [Aeromicrobium sp.]